MVGLVILNYNNVSDTLNCIKSVLKYTHCPIKIVLVDNGSTKEGVVNQLHEKLSGDFNGRYLRLQDQDLDKVTTLPFFTFIISGTNDGYARGNNKGIKILNADSSVDKIMILNNDVLFIEDIIPSLSEKLESLEDAAIVSPILYRRDGKTIDFNCARYNAKRKHEFIKHLFFFSRSIGKAMDKKTSIIKYHEEYLELPQFEVELPSGSCMLLKKSLVQTINMFDPSTFLYCEENILYSQIKSLGLKNYVIPSLSCIHLGGSTTKQESVNVKTLIFIRKCGIESMNYYLKRYTDASIVYILFTKYFSLLEMRIDVFKAHIKNLLLR